MSQDILADAKLDVLNVFHSMERTYSTPLPGSYTKYGIKKMTEMNMLIKTRPRFPSNKLTFTIPNIIKGLTSRGFLILLFNLNGRFDVDVVLEDSQRNFLSSLILLLFGEFMVMSPTSLFFGKFNDWKFSLLQNVFFWSSHSIV